MVFIGANLKETTHIDAGFETLSALKGNHEWVAGGKLGDKLTVQYMRTEKGSKGEKKRSAEEAGGGGKSAGARDDGHEHVVHPPAKRRATEHEGA